MDNRIFSPARFGLYLRKFIFENRNRIAVNTGVLVMFPIIFCCFIPLVLQCYNDSPNAYNRAFDPMWSREISFFVLITLVMACAFGSVFYESLKKKTARIPFLTIPVTPLEKFTTFFMIYIIFYSVIITGAMFLADAVRVLIYSGTATEGIKVGMLSPRMLFTLGADINRFTSMFAVPAGTALPDQSIMEMAMFYSAIILGQAFFAMGSSVWPKNSLLKSACFLMAFNMVSGYLMYLGFEAFYDVRVMGREWLENLTAAKAGGWLVGISAALAIFMWWISYRRMKEWEIIQRW